MKHPVRRIAEEVRRKIDDELVDEAFTQERAVELVTRFDVNLVQLAPRELAHERGEIYFTVRVRQRDELNAAGAERSRALGVFDRCCDEGTGPQHTRVLRRF